MTESEALLRAVIDNPGDETPRLAYADWLDERNDPRGRYLRAESAWASAWRKGTAPAYSPSLRATAEGLDPLWVTRLTRTPQGVCCDHLSLTGNGHRLEPNDLADLEGVLGISLPHAYRAFLLNYNHALAAALLRGPHPDTGRSMTFRFFPLPPGKFSGGGSYGKGFGWWNCPNSGREPCLQIGLFGKTGNCLLQLGRDPIDGRDLTGQIWYYTLRPDRRRFHAPDLAVFLDMLSRA